MLSKMPCPHMLSMCLLTEPAHLSLPSFPGSHHQSIRVVTWTAPVCHMVRKGPGIQVLEGGRGCGSGVDPGQASGPRAGISTGLAQRGYFPCSSD